MTSSSDRQEARQFWLRELWSVVHDHELQAAAKREVPALSRLPLRRFRHLLQYLGGILIGVWVALITIFFMFVVFNRYLHLGAN